MSSPALFEHPRPQPAPAIEFAPRGKLSSGSGGTELRSTLNLVLPLAISVACVSLCYTFLEIRTERRNLRNELTRRSAIVAENIAETIESSRDKVTSKNLSHLLYRYVPRESLSGIAVYD